MNEIEHILPVRNKLGEGPVWSIEEQKLYWVDITSGTYSRYDPAAGSYETFNIGVPLGVLALRERGGLVMATKKGFAFWDEQQKVLDFIAQPEADRPYMSFNDGAVDCRGRFWAGTKSEAPEPQPEGTLYRLDPDLSLHSMVSGVGISNGIGWSPDNTIMYFTDSPRHIIYAYDFAEESGAISNQRTFAYTPDEPYEPDGLAVDSEGYVWSACWDAAKIIRYAPSGAVDNVIQVPALRPTSCVFGGQSLDELYITSSVDHLNDEQRTQYPYSGDLFRLKAGVKGLPKYRFAG
ncbi:MAG TPA: SMP-30/gluconolactonase/LRE family protein [Ktedonobacteraceae bacterium]|nr:SMP-30/gluconolactonase/LRE family protein [Ktedonobacteraceae bacterium]